ncbi:MAG: SDR family oxidoreductase [Gemmataceae bacterium]
MHVLVLGCGYLGKLVAERCERVTALTRSPERAVEFQRRGWHPIIGDILDPSLRLPEADVTVFAVGFDRRTGRSRREVYVGGLRNVLTLLPQNNRLIYVSSTGVYAQTDGSEVNETSPTEALDETGRVVCDAERLLLEYQPDAIRLRFAGIYGPGRFLRTESIKLGEPVPGNPDAWLNLIHVEDGARAVMAAIRCGASGEVYNVVDNEPVKRHDYFVHLARLVGAPPVVFAPEQPSRGRTTNRRVSNRRMREQLGVELIYPTYREGLA